MANNDLDIQAMMQEANLAASQNNYKEAGHIYGIIAKHGDLASTDKIEATARYAFCLEKSGSIARSIQYYQKVADGYKRLGKESASQALELKISVLGSLSAKRKKVKIDLHKKKKVAKAPKKPSISQGIDKKTNELLGFLALDTRDIQGQKRSLNLDNSDYDFDHFLHLGTKDISAEQLMTATLELAHLVDDFKPEKARHIEFNLEPMDDQDEESNKKA